MTVRPGERRIPERGDATSRDSPGTIARRAGVRRSGWCGDQVRRATSVLVIFASTFGLDTATGNRWFAIRGNAAILLSVSVVFPGMRPGMRLGMLAGLSYVAVWTLFNIVRAFMDDVPWATARLDLVGEVEKTLAGGQLPTVWLAGYPLLPRRSGVV